MIFFLMASGLTNETGSGTPPRCPPFQDHFYSPQLLRHRHVCREEKSGDGSYQMRYVHLVIQRVPMPCAMGAVDAVEELDPRPARLLPVMQVPGIVVNQDLRAARRIRIQVLRRSVRNESARDVP